MTAGIHPTEELVDYLLRVSQKLGDVTRENERLKRERTSSAQEAFVAGAEFYADRSANGATVRAATVAYEAQKRYSTANGDAQATKHALAIRLLSEYLDWFEALPPAGQVAEFSVFKHEWIKQARTLVAGSRLHVVAEPEAK
jgi:hypothetical protein